MGQSLFVLIILLALFSGCGDDEESTVAPTVTTATETTNITPSTATSGGNITSDGGATITARGVCWSTSSNPTTANDKTTDGTGLGTFTSNLTGLTAKTPYHIRAYATNSVGTAYGSEVTFTTPSLFIGNFVISSAKVAAPSFSLVTTTGMQIPVPVGQDITQAIQTALLSSVNCSSADKSWVELRKDNSVYMSCEGANAFSAGTWEEIDAKTLKLNMNSTAIPSSPTGFVLTVTDIVQGTTGWTGKTSVPMPKEMFAATLAGYGMTIAATPAVYLVPFSMDFVKK